MITKSVLAIQPTLAHVYNTAFPNDVEGASCFECLGYDIMLDSDYHPWLIEVNHSPSFTCDSPLDTEIKHTLLYQVLKIVNLTPSDRILYNEREKAKAEQRLGLGTSKVI